MPLVRPEDRASGEPLPGWKGQFFHSATMTFSHYEIAAGASLHEHHHENEEVWHVIDGTLVLTVDGVDLEASAGCAVVVPGDHLHGARAVTDCKVIVADSPVRPSLPGGITAPSFRDA